MATERDLSDLLPPFPPPRPARREETIGAAMRRFDGEPAVAKKTAPQRSWWATRRPQLGGLVAVALIAAVGLPMWLSGDHLPPVASSSENVTAADVSPPTAPVMADVAEAPPPGDTPPEMLTPPQAARAVAPAAPSAAVPAESVAAAPLLERAAPAPPPPPPPPPPPAAMAAADEASDAANIVVTGSRVSGRAKAQARIENRYANAGAWNACTVDDPRKDPAACNRAQRLRSGAAGESAGLVGQGLDRAWQDDDAGAINAFDQAIKASPRSGQAWLNRGIVRARQGDDAGALADLDKAVKYAPYDARTWMQRSMILRRQGKTTRADADAARAIRLDPTIDKVFQ